LDIEDLWDRKFISRKIHKKINALKTASKYIDALNKSVLKYTKQNLIGLKREVDKSRIIMKDWHILSLADKTNIKEKSKCKKRCEQ
jgi:hypothetical protein